MKKVLQISKYYYPFIGGTEQVALDIARALAECDVEQKVICFNEDAAVGEYTTKRHECVRESVCGVEVIRCGCIAKIASQSISLCYGGELKKVFQEFKPDIVILHYPNPFATRYLLKYTDNDFKLFVYWHMDITKQKILKKFFYNQNLKLIDRADRVLGATPKHLEESEFTPEFGDKKTLLPYAIDEERLRISESEIEEAKKLRDRYAGKTICFFIGRHVKYKGLEYLIDAAKLVKSNVQFIVAGKGELTESLKEQAAGCDNVGFVGKLSDSERRKYLYACDIFCFPSITRNEGFGLALAEGMYYGKPAVTFTVHGSGVNFLNLDGVTGIECPNADAASYAEAIDRLSQDKEQRERYGKAARERVLQNFTFESFMKNVKELIDD